MINDPEVFGIQLDGKILLYAPLHDLLALVNRSAAQEIFSALKPSGETNGVTRPILERLRSPARPAPTPTSGNLEKPLFLGLIPTRGCNLACVYCDFAADTARSPVMSYQTARAALDSYFDLLLSTGEPCANVHFFGGEPFYSTRVVDFAVEYSELRARKEGFRLHFEVTTNGLFSPIRCQWIASHFDTVVLSLDGPADLQERQRPALSRRKTFPVVDRTARLLSESPVELVLRVCVTNLNVSRLEEIAMWVLQEYRPSTVCFERLNPSRRSQSAGLFPPDPWEFTQNFDRAACLLESQGIETVLSTAIVEKCQFSFCPVGKDALIVSPDGSIDACYLLKDDWESQGLDLHLGNLNGNGFDLEPAALQRIRDLSASNRLLCAGCLCRYHCAGGCHVHNDTSHSPGDYPEACIQTRLVTVSKLLRKLGQAGLAKQYATERQDSQAFVFRQSDLLTDLEVI
ncbi:MAG TPA: radical SAM protein [Anaerolineales bacterium]|nr:radical SAM protein [Anaerolineales bacterium]